MVSTGSPGAILSNSATVTGRIVDLGEGVTQYGHCYGENQGVDISDLRTNFGTALKAGEFESELTGLRTNTKYFVKAYASSAKETVYGSEIEFITPPPMPPTVFTSSITNITQNTADGGGNVTSDGGAPVTSRGVCWNTTGNPTVNNSKTINGSGTGSFTSSITGLQPCVIYHVRAYATNSAGTGYGNEISFTTAGNIPTVTTAAVTGITRTTAISGGNITSDGCISITVRGVCWSTSANPTVAGAHTTNGSGPGSFTSNLTGLSPNTTYHVRAYATHSQGTAYGNNVSFTTPPVTLATLTTNSVTSITSTTAVSGGNITNDGGGTITARGVCWNTSANPTISNPHTNNGTGSGNFTSNITGLTSGTTYYLRAYATNSAGTGYGNQYSFITPVTDVEGNVYKTVVIGTQVWMAENLKTTRFNDGASISLVTDNIEWGNQNSPGYCWLNNDFNNKNNCGGMYNWYAVNNGKLCPDGWHVPSDEDFKILEIHLGMSQSEANAMLWRGTNQGEQLKNTSGWPSGDNGTNTSGFSALPGGFRKETGEFVEYITDATWWTSTGLDANNSWMRGVRAGYSQVGRNYKYKNNGLSVRCVKN